VAFAVAIAAVAFGTATRIQTSLSQPNFNLERAEGMFKSDPGLLYYLTQRVVDAGGRVPEDFRSDTRIEHPEARDLASMFTVGSEFLIARAYLLFGGDLPLHAFAFFFMAGIASLTAIGVFGLAAEVTRRPGAAAFAAFLYATSWINYRTTSFIFMREDLSLPLYALHLWLLARAARIRTASAYAWVGLSLLFAISTWHATSVVVLAEVACLFGWSLVTGQNPLAARRAWIAPAVVAVGSIAVPVLHAKLFVLSPTLQIAVALLAVSLLEKRFGPQSAWQRISLHLGSLGGAALIAMLFGRALATGGGDFAHVFDLLWAKLRFLGQRPADPALLSFGARIMWQGPFESGSPMGLLRNLPLPLMLLPLEIPALLRMLRRPEGDARGTLVVICALVWVVLSLLAERNGVFLGIVGPVTAALALRHFRRKPAALFLSALVIGHLWWMSAFIEEFKSTWYQPRQQKALRLTIKWIRANLPPEGAIASDVINSTALLAHTEHPITLQPKYETRASRNRMERFIMALYHERPETFARVLREEFDCTYLLVDPKILAGWRYMAGLRPWEPAQFRGSAAMALLAPVTESSEPIPGFELLYTTPPARRTLRLYRIRTDSAQHHLK
jgi:hypothetical protein